MHYVTKTDMLAIVPEDILTVAVDDRNYGADVDSIWPIIADAASRRVDSILGSRYTVPFTGTLPPLVKEAAVIFAAHMLYLRRQVGDNNPFAKEATAMMTRLEAIAAGKADLTASSSDSDAVAITEPSLTYRPSGRMLA